MADLGHALDSGRKDKLAALLLIYGVFASFGFGAYSFTYEIAEGELTVDEKGPACDCRTQPSGLKPVRSWTALGRSLNKFVAFEAECFEGRRSSWHRVFQRRVRGRRGKLPFTWSIYQ